MATEAGFILKAHTHTQNRPPDPTIGTTTASIAFLLPVLRLVFFHVSQSDKIINNELKIMLTKVVVS